MRKKEAPNGDEEEKYGSTPEDLFEGFLDRSEFVKYSDWTSHVRRGAPEAQAEEEFAKPKGGLDG